MARALCIGINDYPGTGSDLKGCVNDAQDWDAALQERGLATELMLDRDATKQAIHKGIRKIVADTGSGEVGVITFSGHGSWKPDESGDEPDMRDELLCPYDINDGQYLSDDELYELYGDRQRGARIVMISDSCHSGSVAKLAPPDDQDDTPDRVRFLAPEFFLEGDLLFRARAIGRPRVVSRPRTTALLMAGCQDDEYSYDASFNGRPNGAFTHVALRALQGLARDASYSDWFRAIQGSLPSASHPQSPNLAGTSHQRRWQIFA
jgi:hypothetical protein